MSVIHHSFLILGGGMAAASAVHGIRNVDAQGSIGLISEESDLHYNRPPLAKGLWQEDTIDSIWSDLDNHGVTCYLGRTVAAIESRLQARHRHTRDGLLHK